MAASAATARRTPRFDAAPITASSHPTPGRFSSESSCRSMTGGATNLKTVALTGRWQEGDRPLHSLPARRHVGARVGLYRSPHGSSHAADGEVCKAREGAPGPRLQALEQRAGTAHLRDHVPAPMEDVARALHDATER